MNQHPPQQRRTPLAWLADITNRVKPVRCHHQYMFDELVDYPGKVYRQVKSRQTKEIHYQQHAYFVKLHYGIGWKETCKNILRGRWPVFGAANEWQAITKCTQTGILTTPLVGYGQWGRWQRQRSFIITRALTNMCSLEDLGKLWQQSPPPFQLKRQLIRELAKVARIFHQQGMHHRDFYLCHFLVPNTMLTAQLPLNDLLIYVIDLHRVQIRSKLSQRKLAKDLSALLFSALNYGLTLHDYLYFIKCYTDLPLKFALSNRPFWRKVTKRAVKLYCKEEGKYPKQIATPT